jgi:methylthioribose-1-phosphate isomerase
LKQTIDTIIWRDDHIAILDQTRLPAEEQYLHCRDLDAVAAAIRRLAVRGAPAIGVAAAMALALEARSLQARNRSEFIGRLEELVERLIATRPTAVNLQWALQRMMQCVREAGDCGIQALKALLVDEARAMHDRDIETNRALGRHGQALVPDQATVITICNTGSLATAGYGTALGVVRAAVEAGKRVHVVVCETRPLLQGARLTAWELKKDGIPFELITDSMAGSYLRRRGADCVIAGADRIAANGDTANKIGTYSLAILAHAHGVPFFIAAPTSTIDTTTPDGDGIPIEERDPGEITGIGRQRVAPEDIRVWNPAFDVVPGRYITGIITERGILRPPFCETIHRMFTDMHNCSLQRRSHA